MHKGQNYKGNAYGRTVVSQCRLNQCDSCKGPNFGFSEVAMEYELDSAEAEFFLTT